MIYVLLPRVPHINIMYCTLASTNCSLITVVPTTYGLSLIVHHVQIVGQSLTLECSVTTVRGITSRVSFIWSSNDTVLKVEEMNSQDFTIQNLNIYSSSYTIALLGTQDDGKSYQCEVLIDASPPIIEFGNVTLDVTGIILIILVLVLKYFYVLVPTPTVSITPSGPIQGAMVGSPQDIQCTVSTVSGVELSSVMISWMGPGGDTITNDSRVTISPTSGSGNNYSSSLQFMYLMEGDEGTYECSVMILETTASYAIIIENLIGKIW